MSLLLNILSRLVITFLPRSKRLLISWLQSPSAVILEPPKIKSLTVCPSISHEVMGPDAMILVFWKLSFKPTFSLSSFTFIKRIFSSSSLSAISVMLSAYLMLLIFLPATLIPAYASSSPAFLMYSAYKLNKQGDNIQPWHTPFPIWNQSVVPCPVLTVASWPAYRFLKRQVRWSGIAISQNFPLFIVIHTVKGFGIVNKAAIDVFLELSCLACILWGFPAGSDGKKPACNARDPVLIPGLGRSLGEGNGNPPHYSCQGNPMDRRGWRAIVHGVAKSWTWLKQLSSNSNIPLYYIKMYVLNMEQQTGSK